MGTNATVSEIVAAIRAALPIIAENQARAMIKANNIRSITKAEAVAGTYAGKTAEDFAKEFGEATPDAPDAVANTKKPAAKKAAGAKTATAKEPKAPREPRRQATAVTEGPRGFRFGEVWNNSVKSQTGVAMLVANRAKLLKQAAEHNITHGADDSAEDIAKKIAKKL